MAGLLVQTGVESSLRINDIPDFDMCRSSGRLSVDCGTTGALSEPTSLDLTKMDVDDGWMGKGRGAALRSRSRAKVYV